MVQGEGPQGRPGSAGAGGAGGAPEGGAERRPPCGPRPAACRGWGEAGRSPDGRDARRSGRKSADAARRAAGLRPGVPAAGRGAKGPRRSRGQGDHSPSSPMNSRMREPCGMSSAPMEKK